MSYKQKKNLITIGIILLAIATVFAVVAIVKNVNADENYSTTRTNWTVGGLTEEGRIDVDVEKAMVSDRIEIGYGFKVDPEFNKGVEYQVYFYDESDSFLGTYSEELLNRIIEVNEEDLEEMFAELELEVPTYFRVLMIPDDKDGEINLFEKWNYATHINIFELETAKN